MSNNIHIFIIFHKFIFDECYINIPDDILKNNFTFVAVNKNITKTYTNNKYNIINEWELPIYDNTFQERGYNENSAIYHIYANNLHKNYKYIGFFQYDMIFNDNIIDFCSKHINQSPIYFTFSNYDFDFCNNKTWNEQTTSKYIINNYEEYNKKQFNQNILFPLYNSYIIPMEIYEKIMKWVTELYNKLYPWCIEHPNHSHFGHIGGIYERIMAFAIGQENLEYIKLNISHDHKYKSLSY